MLKSMGPFFIFLLLFACGDKKSIQYGMTSKSLLIEIKGEPQKVDEVPGGEVFTYKGNEKFQINKNKVSASFRDPSGDERNVIFWRHAFRDCDVKEIPLSDETIPEMELSCPSRGQSIVFTKNSGKVSRMTEYERK
jgi:hypothetical protein